jgi:hypothetical protein
VQIAGYRTGPDDPALVLAAEGNVERVPLESGTELAYPLGGRRCAGLVDDGTHYPCDRPKAPYCDRHARDWAPSYADEEYAVYLAAFAPDSFKVGITRSWRLDTRLREQGADLAAHIHTVSSGPIARNVEREIAAGMPEAVRVDAKIDGLAAAVDREAWRALLDEYPPIETFAFDYGLSFADRPVAETVATGTVLGTKGRVLVLRRGGTVYATDLRALVGFAIATETEADRDRQTSLGAF